MDDTVVSAHTLLLICWTGAALLCVLGVVFVSQNQGAREGSNLREGRVQAQQKDFVVATKFLLAGVILLGIVFLVPDAGRVEHRSFFSVAAESPWGQLFDWPAAWCSAKIIALSISALLILEAMLTLAMRAQQEIACMALLVLAVFPVLLGVFGFYQFVKAVF